MVDIKKKKDSDGGNYFAVAHRKRNRYLKIYIPIVAAAAIVVVGFVFAIEAQGGPMPGAKMVLHIHPHLNIIVDGKPMAIPQNVGIDGSLWKDHSLDKYGMVGMAPLHTHDTSGIIHVESNTNRGYELGQLLGIWGGLDLNGKTVKATVDGKAVSDYRNISLKDGEQINLNIS